MGLWYGPLFDSGGLCSMGPHLYLVYNGSVANPGFRFVEGAKGNGLYMRTLPLQSFWVISR